MNTLSLDELNLVLDQLCEKRDELQDQIDSNAIVISEMDSAGSKFYGDSDENYDLFSPRKKSSSKQKVRLEKDRQEFEEQNNQLFLERNKVNILIDTIQRVLDAEKLSDQDEAEDTSDTSDPTGTDSEERKTRTGKRIPEKDLAAISHKIDLCKKFIDQDPRRAKVELDGVQKKLKKFYLGALSPDGEGAVYL